MITVVEKCRECGRLVDCIDGVCEDCVFDRDYNVREAEATGN